MDHCSLTPEPLGDPWVAHVTKALPALIRQLTPDEQHILIGYFFDGRSIEDLAQHLEDDPERVQALLEGALDTLRRHLCG